MALLVVLNGPIAAGKNTVAEELARLLTGAGRTVVVADVDDIAQMVGAPGAGKAGLWFAAHEAHGALVAQWMRSNVGYVVAVGPFHTAGEQAALTRGLARDAATLWVVIDAAVAVTLARAQADPGRGLSRDPQFHRRAHNRFRHLLPMIPADMTFDSAQLEAHQIAAAIAGRLGIS